MGAFVNTLIVKGRKAADVKNVLDRKGDDPSWNLVPAECQYREYGGGTAVLLSDMCAGYDAMTQELSEELACPVMLCYIYDGDFWGYFFFDSGRAVDTFMPMPNYFEEVPEEEQKKAAGSSSVIAGYFDVDEADIRNYLRRWPDGIWDSDEEARAYDGDEACIGQDWQMADFMRALGYPYEW